MRMLSLIAGKRKRQRRAKPGTGLKALLRQRVEQQVADGVPRQAVYSELRTRSRAVLTDGTTPRPHLHANAYLAVADEVLHVMLARNLQGERCEQEGRIDRAIRYYEANVADGFYGMRPYERLRLIYTGQHRHHDAIRICQAYLALSDKGNEPARETFRGHLQALLGETQSERGDRGVSTDWAAPQIAHARQPRPPHLPALSEEDP